MNLLVIGAGQMGGGIAQVAARSGDNAVLLDRDASYVERCFAAIGRNLSRSVERGRSSAVERPATLARIVPAADWFGDPKYRACPLLRAYVAAGWLGRKSGLGFYDWRGDTRARRADMGASGVPDFGAH